MSIEHVLPVVWYFIIGFAVLMYVLLDGFVLGIGILTPFADDDQQRDHMMNTAAPIWDGNETWLVMGGAGLMAAFPIAYSTVLSALYLPILAMLIALIFRGIAFEFRFKQRALRRLWDGAFCGGAVVATFAQGVVLGTFIQGFKVDGRHFSGSSFDWVSPFPLAHRISADIRVRLVGCGMAYPENRR